MDQDKKKPHHRQCTIDDRLVIQQRLNELFSFNAIAKEIGKHRTTVSLEVRRNSVAVQKGAFGRPFNDCAHRRACDHRQLCEDKPDCLRKCSICALCNQVCPDYEKERCPRLSEPPYVCNGCPKRQHCTLEKHVYDARQADKVARDLLVTSRQGICITPEELAEIDDLLTKRVKLGQTINHIYQTDPGYFNICQDTLRKYIALKLFTCRNGDLTQRDIDRVASHHNSYIRPILGNRTPIAVARERYGQALLDALNITEIHPRDVILTPALLDPRQP